MKSRLYNTTKSVVVFLLEEMTDRVSRTLSKEHKERTLMAQDMPVSETMAVLKLD